MSKRQLSADPVAGILGMLAIGGAKDRAVAQRYHEAMSVDVQRIRARLLRSALIRAIASDDTLLATSVLCSGITIKPNFPRFASALRSAIAGRDKPAVLRIFVERKLICGRFASALLVHAARHGAVRSARVLFRAAGINVNFRYRRYFPLYSAARAGHTQMVRLLLRHPDIKANQFIRRTVNGERNSLTAAIAHYKLDTVMGLLKSNKVDPNCIDRLGYAPIHHAIDATRRHRRVEILELFLQSPRVCRSFADTDSYPLVAYGTWVDHEGSALNALLSCPDININELVRETGQTALHNAVRVENTKYAIALCRDRRCDDSIRDKTGKLAREYPMDRRGRIAEALNL